MAETRSPPRRLGADPRLHNPPRLSRRLIGTPYYTVLAWGELLVVLMLLDAAFSGDWSRIGAISKGGQGAAGGRVRGAAQTPPPWPQQCCATPRAACCGPPAETELALQKVSAIVLIGHLGTAMAAGWLARQKGRSPVLPAVKVRGRKEGARRMAGHACSHCLHLGSAPYPRWRRDWT